METIIRQISLENLKSRQPSLIPTMGSEDSDGNFVLSECGGWGGYPYDIDINKCYGFETLKIFFGYPKDSDKSRVSFKEITNKWHLFREIFEKSQYYKKIVKNGLSEWVVYEPLYKEKFNINIFSEEEFNGENFNEKGIIGVYENDDFKKNGGLLMVAFVMKAVGMFCVDDKYITDTNYVPEILYYTDVNVLYKKLRDMKNSIDCCVKEEYGLFGGDAFLAYLGAKNKEMKNEFKYWENALYLDENEKPLSPYFTIDVALTADFMPLGIFTTVEPLDKNDYIFKGRYPENYKECKIITPSRLSELRRTQKTYCFNKKTQKDEEMPVIMDDIGKDKFEFIPKYGVGTPKNFIVANDKYYGDMIYDLKVEVDEETEEEYVVVKYVFGGELKRENGVYTYSEKSKTGIRYEERLKYEKHDYTKDIHLEIKQISPHGDVEINVLNKTYINNCDIAEIIYDSENDEVEGIFYMDYPKDMTDYKLIMMDYNLGKTEQIVENIEDVTIDRGYASAFELHYKMGEVNTFEDLERYQNNIFGI